MKTTAKHLRAAERELELRRERAEAGQRQRREAALRRIPALETLEQQIAQSGSAIVNALGRGEEAVAYMRLLAQQNLAAQAERERLLQAAGLPANHLEPRYTCPVCCDSGYVMGQRCACFKELLRQQAYRELCMDAPLESSTFNSFVLEYYSPQAEPASNCAPRDHMAQVLAFCEQYAEAFDRCAGNLLFQGATGLGKTHLSLAIAQRVIENGYGVIYGSAQNLFHRLEREHFARFGENTGEAEQALLECDLLILDDLGAEFSTTFTVSALYNIINTRINRALPTIINTNLTAKQREEIYSQRVTSRIIGHYTTLRFLGSDVRQAKQTHG
ncbi:MAG: ATP-binding protein [Oscillospiraceae bacterium]|jgi:DNA replication protein DnaC|nr:ATP-binding protein [Oscillospiraceae bacterium]